MRNAVGSTKGAIPSLVDMRETLNTYKAQIARGRIAVCYHYFAHYREPVNQELIEAGEFRYEFFGETHSYDSGIKLTTKFADDRFHRVRGWTIGPMLIQPAVIRLALSPKYKAIILLGNPKWPTMWAAAILGRLTGKRVLMWTHGWLNAERGPKRVIRNIFHRLSHSLLVYGHRAKNIGVKHMGFSPDRIHVIYNSLDTKLQDKIRATITKEEVAQIRSDLFGDRAHHPVLINVTRLHPVKKLDLLLEAAAELEQQGTPVNVLIVGDGPHRPDLEALAAQLGVTARFAGAVYDERELALMFTGADLTVMPGPIGLLVMHSLAYGTPVISNDDFDSQMPEVEAIVDGQTGSYFKANDVTSMVSAIKEWIDRDDDPDQRRARAREMIAKYYNPVSQRQLIDRAVRGDSPDDLSFPRLRTLPGVSR